MSLQTSLAIEQIVVPNVRDIGDFAVRRALPSAQRRMVGPFIFLDAFGPVRFEAGHGMDTRLHPHIGLSTISYLLEGELRHRDSAGHEQMLPAGGVNLMNAGRGIVHSERSPDAARAAGGALAGLQGWIALPQANEEDAPGFQYLAPETLPVAEGEGTRLVLLAGASEGLRSPARVFSHLFYADLSMRAGARHRVAAEHIERAFYVIEGELRVEGEEGTHGADRFVVLRPGAEVVLRATRATRVLLLGGEPLDGPRHIYWNFVSSRTERILQAAEDWRAQRFPDMPEGEEIVPLPRDTVKWRFKT